MRTHCILLAATAAAALTLGGCTAAASTSQTDAPRTLELAYFDPDSSYDPALDWFSGALDDISGGRLSVNIKWECCDGQTTGELEAGAINAVGSGEVDLGVVGVRALDIAGASQLDGLLAPMQIDSYDEQKAVLQDPAIRAAARSIEHLGDSEVTVAGLLPGPERYPLSATAHPLLGAADWKGREIHIADNRVAAAAVAALGATPSSRPDRDDRLATGELSGIENSVLWYADYETEIRSATMNVALWPKPDAVLIGAQARKSLSATQLGWIRKAADRAVEQTTDLQGFDDSFAALCTFPATTASPSAIAGLIAALEPVHRTLAADPRSSAVLARVDELAGPPAAATPPPRC